MKGIADACQTTLNLPEPLKIPAEYSSKIQATEALSRLHHLASEVSSVRWFRWHADQ